MNEAKFIALVSLVEKLAKVVDSNLIIRGADVDLMNDIKDDIATLKRTLDDKYVNSNIWHHLTRGTKYMIEDINTLQTTFPIKEGTILVHYRSIEDGKSWSRPYSEFFDGRYIKE